MARTIVILCDPCLERNDEEVQAVAEETISFGGIKPRLLAVCAKCQKEFVDPLRDLIMDIGQIVDSVPPLPTQKGATGGGGNAKGEFECLECGRQYNYKGSLRTHVQDKHGMTLQEMAIRHSGDNPDAQLQLGIDDENKPEVTRAECDQEGCDVVYEWPQHVRPAQAIGVHKARAHGIKGQKKAKASAA